MKFGLKKALALLIALMLAVPTFAFADEPADEIAVSEDQAFEEEAGNSHEVGPLVEAVGEIPLPDLSDALTGGLSAEDASQSDPDAVVTYCFIVDDTLLAEQTVREGEEIASPADPAAPEGYTFVGWFLEDGTRLFEDGPVIAHPDGMVPQVNVYARFEARDGQAFEEPSTGAEAAAEDGGAEALTEEMPGADDVDQPAEPSPVEKADQPEAETDEDPDEGTSAPVADEEEAPAAADAPPKSLPL